MSNLTIEDMQRYSDYGFDGIIVAVPKNSLEANAELYIYGFDINSNNLNHFSMISYNKEDGAIKGFSAYDTTEKGMLSNFEDYTWYHFNDLQEFCTWYLDKAVAKPKTNNQEINKSHLVSYFEQKYGFNPYEEQPPEGLGYWAIYNDENCDNELKRIIEKKCPEIKELASLNAKIVKQYRCGDVYTHDEIRDKINQGWNTRREKLHDVLKLLDLRDLRQNTLDMLQDNMSSSEREHLSKQLERDEKRIEDFLNEKVI